MIQYQVFKKDYQKDEKTLLGILTERRGSRRNVPTLSSGLKWARVIFGRIVKDPHSIFVGIDENQKGATAAEYVILLVLVAAVIVFGISAFGGAIKTLFESFNSVWPK